MQGTPREAVTVARDLLRQSEVAALASLRPDGSPFASYVTVAPDVDCAPILLLSRLAAHTGNLQRDSRSSLLLVATDSEREGAAATARLSLTGRTGSHPDPDRAARLFLARHAEAAGYASFADFGYYRFEIEAGHLVAGFGLISRIEPHDILSGSEAPP